MVRRRNMNIKSGCKNTDEVTEVKSNTFDISADELVSMLNKQDLLSLVQNGGIEGVAAMLRSNLYKGLPLDENDLTKRNLVFGSNKYLRKDGRNFWWFVRRVCQDCTLIAAMGAAAASLYLGILCEGIEEGWYHGGSIALTLLLTIGVNAVSDYREYLQFQNLNEETQNIQVEVCRGGRRIEVSIFEIVVGDIVHLKIGDQVPADGLVVTGHSLTIDESCTTRESKLVHKDRAEAPFLMAGCKVSNGFGSMMVTGVGINSKRGLLMASLSSVDKDKETPLQVRVRHLIVYIGVVALIALGLVFQVRLIRFAAWFLFGEQSVEGTNNHCGFALGLLKILTATASVLHVAINAGLEFAVTQTLAYSMRKIMADKALVRRLSACETLATVTTICSDITGTLTLNQMTVVETYCFGVKVDPPENKSMLPSRGFSLLIEGIAQNTTGSIFISADDGALAISGSSTEKAILQWGVNLGMKFSAARSNSVIIHASPFNSEKQIGGVALKTLNSEIRVHWKGAAETVLDCCASYMDSNDSVVPMDEDKLLYFKNVTEDMAAGSLHCVAMAYRICEMGEKLESSQLPDRDLILLAIVGIEDPFRPGVRDAIQLCTDAGIKVRMVTGENLQRARRLALECGILGSSEDDIEHNLIEGKTFRGLNERQRIEVADRISVMGRSSPNDKLLFVQALRGRRHVVAVTGDGTLDAPALREADIGLAMGNQGTEVAKESSDVIILDDSFASIVKVVRCGRSVYANIQKFFQFQQTFSITALLIIPIAAVTYGNLPLNEVQLLWVNLVINTLGQLALAAEPPTDHLMRRPPVGRSDPLITDIMSKNLIIQALYQVIVLLVLDFGGMKIFSLFNLTHYSRDHAIKVKNTLKFNTFVFCQVCNKFNARKPEQLNVFEGVTGNRLFMGIVVIEVGLQVVINLFLGKFTSTVHLCWQLWLLSLAIGVFSWPVAVLGKMSNIGDHKIQRLVWKIRRNYDLHWTT